MALHADTLLDRMRLKSQVTRWRAVAIVAIVMTLLVIVEGVTGFSKRGPYIARFAVEGMILDDVKRDEFLLELAENDDVKALLVRIDSPGGTIVRWAAVVCFLT